MRLILALAILAFGLVVLVVNHDSGQSFGIANEDFGHAVRLLPFAALLSVGLVASRRSLGQSA
ncbi:MAG: TIGR02281 family clan AA aspartic protease, partial [Rhizobium sp.]|nr:TIGR02281 family clan AA aspartic protease [Rhizobium sp.]